MCHGSVLIVCGWVGWDVCKPNLVKHFGLVFCVYARAKPFNIDIVTSMFPQLVTTLKPMYPRALSTTIGVAGRLIPWGGLDGGGMLDIVRLVLNLL